MRKRISSSSLENLLDAVEQARQPHGLLVGLDYDGTLVDIAPRPELARPGEDLVRLLGWLTSLPDLDLVVVSGRPLSQLRELLPLPRLHLLGSHGGEGLIQGRLMFLAPWVPSSIDLRVLTSQLEALLAGLCGWWLEPKSLGVAVHYRQASQKEAESLHQGLAPWLASLQTGGRWQVLWGRKVVELLPAGVSKGAGFCSLLQFSGFTTRFPLYIGDDVTDETVFTALAHRGLTVKVGRQDQATGAAYWLAGPAQVHRLLAWLALGG